MLPTSAAPILPAAMIKGTCSKVDGKLPAVGEIRSAGVSPTPVPARDKKQRGVEG